jgi:uncharacterized protein (DUF983 family)
MTEPVHYGAAARPSFFASLRRGLAGRCPRCGRGPLLHRYLKAHESCASCGLPFEPLRSDDAAPYFTILIAGHVIVPLILLVEQHIAPPVWLQLAIWLPATAALTLLLLPFVKGGVMAAIWSLKAKDPSDTSA